MAMCPHCQQETRYVQEYNAWYCDTCGQYLPTDQGTGMQAGSHHGTTAYPAQPSHSGQATLAQSLFNDMKFVIKQKKLSLANRKYYVENSSGQTVAFVQRKLLQLKEDITIYPDESKSTEIMKIQQANILNFSGSYQVKDSQSGQIIGILKRKGWKSMLKDEWKILDANQTEMGKVREQGGIVWYLRRFNFRWIPYKYYFDIHGQDVGTITEKFQIIGDTYFIDLLPPAGRIDPRLAVAIGLMMDIGEGE